LRSKEQGILKTFVIGDIHGALKLLLQCLKFSNFDKSQDRLICLGDVCDRGNQVKECIDELLTIPNCIYILGNHDAWALEWAIHGIPPEGWLEQGGAQTVKSYKKTGVPKEHIQFLTEAPVYFVDHDRLFVHAGFDPQCPVEETPKQTLLWDRSLLKKAQEMCLTAPDYKFGNYNEVFIGHTPTINFGSSKPQQFCNIWALDTGAGWGARLTIMDVDTKQFWQS
jgi:serine/threonine protein phosphatase 1